MSSEVTRFGCFEPILCIVCKEKCPKLVELPFVTGSKSGYKVTRVVYQSLIMLLFGGFAVKEGYFCTQNLVTLNV